MIDEQRDALEPPGEQKQLPVPPPAIGKFRGVLHELETLYKTVNFGRSVKERVHAAYAFLRLGTMFLLQDKDELVTKFCEDMTGRLDQTRYPMLTRKVAVNVDGQGVVRIEVPTIRGGVTGAQDVLPGFHKTAEDAITEEVLADFLDGQLQPLVQALAFELMQRGVLRRESRIASRVNPYFARPESENTDEIDDEETDEEEIADEETDEEEME